MGQFEGVKVVTRECGRGLGVGGCRTRVLGGGAQATICSCTGDLCNITAGSGGVIGSLALVMGSLIMAT